MIQHIINHKLYIEHDNRIYDQLKRTAILYSPGTGAGWSTWASTHYSTKEGLERLIFCPELVLAILNFEAIPKPSLIQIAQHENNITDIQDKHFPDACCNSNLKIYWLPQGFKFKIMVNDLGSEWIETPDKFGWLTA
jgi:hypothetical protein